MKDPIKDVPLFDRRKKSPAPSGFKLGLSGHDTAALPLAPPPLPIIFHLSFADNLKLLAPF